MALKSNREGLRNGLVDYLGNIIIDKKLKQDIITAINDVYVNKSDVLTLEEIQASSDLTGKIAEASALKTNRIIPTNISSNVTTHFIYRYGNIVYGRIRISYSSDGLVLLNLPAPIVSGFFPITNWTDGRTINGHVFINDTGACTYFGEGITGDIGCMVMYLCS